MSPTAGVNRVRTVGPTRGKSGPSNSWYPVSLGDGLLESCGQGLGAGRDNPSRPVARRSVAMTRSRLGSHDSRARALSRPRENGPETDQHRTAEQRPRGSHANTASLLFRPARTTLLSCTLSRRNPAVPAAESARAAPRVLPLVAISTPETRGSSGGRKLSHLVVTQQVYRNPSRAGAQNVVRVTDIDTRRPQPELFAT